jgi:hypothetical protein
VTAFAANVEQFHASFGASLLGLEKDGFGVLATRAGLCRSRELQRAKEIKSASSL